MNENEREAPDAQASRTGISRVIHAGRYSMNGLVDAWSEAAFRQEVMLAVVMIPAALYFGRTGVERALLIGSVFIVLIAELLNTAIERLTDLASPQWHALAKAAKDVGSASVFVALALCVITWLLVLVR